MGIQANTQLLNIAKFRKCEIIIDQIACIIMTACYSELSISSREMATVITEIEIPAERQASYVKK